MTSEHDPLTTPAECPVDAERRAALEKLGKLAALTPPTILTLLISPRASAWSVPVDPENP